MTIVKKYLWVAGFVEHTWSLEFPQSQLKYPFFPPLIVGKGYKISTVVDQKND
jgi:hypothetical protein